MADLHPAEGHVRQAAALGWVARAWARLLGSRPRREGGMWVCAGLPRWAFPRGGVTYGDTYLCGSAAVATSPARLRHERVHVDQWVRHGMWFAVLYLRAGRDPRRNRFEVEAGLADAGYGEG